MVDGVRAVGDVVRSTREPGAVGDAVGDGLLDLRGGVRGAHGRATAEWAVTCLLAVRRGLPGFVADQQERRWVPRPTPGLVDAHVLVIGAGDIGHHIKRRLQAFDAEVTMMGRVERAGVRSVASLDELLPSADAVVLSLPLTPQSRRLVDAHFLAALPDGAVVVNAARGQIIDTAALLAELAAAACTPHSMSPTLNHCRQITRCGMPRTCC